MARPSSSRPRAPSSPPATRYGERRVHAHRHDRAPEVVRPAGQRELLRRPAPRGLAELGERPLVEGEDEVRLRLHLAVEVVAQRGLVERDARPQQVLLQHGLARHVREPLHQRLDERRASGRGDGSHIRTVSAALLVVRTTSRSWPQSAAAHAAVELPGCRPSRPSPHARAARDRGGRGQVDRRTALAAAERVRVFREQIEAARARHASVDIGLASRRTGLGDRRQPPRRCLAYRLFVFFLPFSLLLVAGLGLYSDATDQEADELAERRWGHRRRSPSSSPAAASDTARWWVVVVITVPDPRLCRRPAVPLDRDRPRAGVRRHGPGHADRAAVGGPVRRGDRRTVRGRERRRCALRALDARRCCSACLLAVGALAALWIGVTRLVPHGTATDGAIARRTALRGRDARAVRLRHASHRVARSSRARTRTARWAPQPRCSSACI